MEIVELIFTLWLKNQPTMIGIELCGQYRCIDSLINKNEVFREGLNSVLPTMNLRLDVR